MATPEEMAKYYGNAPKPPEEPTSGSKAEREAYDAAMAEYEAAKEAYEAAAGPPPPPDPVPGAGAGGAGMAVPAARVGDLTSHGGQITVGHPTTFIGGMPAARVSDMHTCPMVTGIVPHVGGPINRGSATVLIGTLPAARVGDQATCVGPPDTIAQGHPTTIIGG